MSKPYIAVRPYDDQQFRPGRRIVVERRDDDTTVHVMSETTLPERVHRTDARRVTTEDWLILSPDEAAWLRDRLTEVLS